MLSSWLILHLLFTLSRAFLGPKHADGRPEAPSCDQLRAFWEMIGRSTKLGYVTNEIPLIPYQARNGLDHLSSGLRRKLHQAKEFGNLHKETLSNNFDFTRPFPEPFWDVQPSGQPESSLPPLTPSDQDLIEIFGKFHEPPMTMSRAHILPLKKPEMFGFGSSSVVPLSDAKNTLETEFYAPQWGSPEEVDNFGNFVEFDIGSPNTAMTRTPKDTVRGWQDESQGFTHQEFSQIACGILLNMPCTMSGQCFCRRSTLMCINGKCQNPGHISDIAEQSGAWHDGPVPRSQVRVLKRHSKRSSRSIFM